MNTIISTTTPAPPTGVTPTEVPLGISGTVSETPSPVNIPRLSLPIFYQQGRGLYLGKFLINTTQTAGSVLFEWSLQQPLFAGNSSFYTPSDSGGQIRYNIGWELMLALFSMQGKMDFDMELIPVKVGDSRASIDFVFTQESAPLVYNSTTLANDSVHKILDDTDDPIKFSIPIIWPTNNIQTRNWSYNTTATPSSKIDFQPAFLPFTKMTAFMRNPYQPNQMQPISFDVLVIIHPKPHSLVGLAGISPVRNTFGLLTDYMPTPWFLTRPKLT